MVHEMCQHFRIRLTFKRHAGRLQFLSDFSVVFNNAVMYQGNPTARNMRVRIADHGAAVRRPTRVGDPHRTVQLFGFNLLRQFLHALHGTRTTDLSALNYCHTAAVVTAVLQTPQAFKKDRHDFLPADAGHNSAHSCVLWETRRHAAVLSRKSKRDEVAL